MCKSILKLQEKNWFIPLIQGSIKCFKYFLQGNKEITKAKSLNISWSQEDHGKKVVLGTTQEV